MSWIISHAISAVKSETPQVSCQAAAGLDGSARPGHAACSSQGWLLARHHHSRPRSLLARLRQCGVVMIADGTAFVVVAAGPGRLGQHRERPPVAGIAEALIADLAGLDVVRTAGCDGYRRGCRRMREGCSHRRTVLDRPRFRRARGQPGLGRAQGRSAGSLPAGWVSNSAFNRVSSCSTAFCMDTTMLTNPATVVASAASICAG